jgi:hypothetical protein
MKGTVKGIKGVNDEDWKAIIPPLSFNGIFK